MESSPEPLRFADDLCPHPRDEERYRGNPARGQVVNVLLGTDERVGAEKTGLLAELREVFFREPVVIPEAVLRIDPDPLLLQGPPEARGVPDRGKGDGRFSRHGVGTPGFPGFVPPVPSADDEARAEDAVLPDEVLDLFFKVLQPVGRHLVGFRDHDEVRPAESLGTFAQESRGEKPPVSPGTERIHQDDVHVSPEPAVLEGVVRDRQFHPLFRPQEGNPLVPVVRHRDRHTGEPVMEQ